MKNMSSCQVRYRLSSRHPELNLNYDLHEMGWVGVILIGDQFFRTEYQGIFTEFLLDIYLFTNVMRTLQGLGTY